MENKKKPWQSKTNWVALIMALAAFIPSVQEVIVANPEGFTIGMGVVFSLLRMVSKDKISIS